ncbi:MAG: hypothetical protein K6G50_05440 [bacterium]|nr:hypothetical protein [bacterium]
MNSVYKDFLFTKHYLVNDNLSEEASQNTEKNIFETLFALANLFNIKIIKGKELALSDMISYASKQLGEKVPKPFYKGFPQSVRELSPDQLLFDQMLHYTITYGFGDFSEVGHSVFEENFQRTAFKENAEIKEFSIITEKEAAIIIAETVKNLLESTRPLSTKQYELVKSYIADYNYSPKNIASKNTCVKLLNDTRNLSLAKFLNLSDVIKLTEELNFQNYKNKNIKKLNLKNQDRKFIASVIDYLIMEEKIDTVTCFEKKKLWAGLLHHLHYHAPTEDGTSFVKAMRGKENHSIYSAFEKQIAEKNIKLAVEALNNGKGSAAVLRNLDFILSRCETDDDWQFVTDRITSSNLIVLMQLFMHYSLYPETVQPRAFKFTKFNMLKVHFETEDEWHKRKSQITKQKANMLAEKLLAIIKEQLKGRLGKVYIAPNMNKYALPVQENTSQGGFGVLPRGSRLEMGPMKKLRAFTYWEKVDDIDLSVIGLTEDKKQMEFSWRTMACNQSEAITYSGDETSGYDGGSEYFDVNIEQFKAKYPEIRYLIFCDNVFSGFNFDECFCKAGYMKRDIDDSGQVYEPKTVKSSFLVNCSSTFAYLFGIDLKTNEFVWINTAKTGNTRVAGTTPMAFLIDYFHAADILNMQSFFEMMAQEVVTDIAQAEVIVTDKTGDYPEGAEVIREYDFEKMIALINARR